MTTPTIRKEVLEFNSDIAESEGWGLFNDGEIQRLDDGPVIKGVQSGTPLFESDDDALEFVKKRATEGSEYHAKAIALLC